MSSLFMIWFAIKCSLAIKNFSVFVVRTVCVVEVWSQVSISKTRKLLPREEGEGAGW